jgi:hypothetical protein
MDLALVLGGDADEQFRARYLERHPAPREQPVLGPRRRYRRPRTRRRLGTHVPRSWLDPSDAPQRPCATRDLRSSRPRRRRSTERAPSSRSPFPGA